MEKQDNTGVGLIIATGERVRNEKSLFSSALKKLVNSTEEELDDFLKGRLSFKGNPRESAVLGPIISATAIPTAIIKFVVKDKFVVDTGNDAKVKISCLDREFRNEFEGKVEETFPGSTIYGRDLSRNSADWQIINEFGGENKIETTLTEVYFMMACHASGVVTGLCANGRANIFYVRNIFGTLRAVNIYWYGHGWRVKMHSIEDRHKRDAGICIFSRNFLASQVA